VSIATVLGAYSDESYEDHNDFVIGGYVAPASEWLKLEEPWRRALSDANLCEFKAHNCEQGEEEFEGRSDRRELQDKFISLIRSIDAVGFATRIDLGAYDALYDRVQTARPKAEYRYFEAYPKVFELQLQFILKYATEKYPGVEKINFVFDETNQFAGRATDLLARQRARHNLVGRERLGSVTFGVSKDLIPLQAADLLAYEVHRELRNGWDSPTVVRSLPV
jgi:Protein of unknown function (DUF3800)